MLFNIYSCLGNKTRVQLLTCLSESPKNVTELISKCGLAQSAVSQHLAKLKKSGLVTFSKNGKEIKYEIKNEKVVQVSKLLIDLEREIK
jgi:DNA-binding transcriptional ArsR family regulator